MVIGPSVQVKPVEGDALIADGNLGEKGAHLGVEAIPIHAQVERCVPEANESGQQSGG